MTLSTTKNEGIALAVLKQMFEEDGVLAKESDALSTIVESSDMSFDEASGAIRGLVENHELYIGPKNTILLPDVPITQIEP